MADDGLSLIAGHAGHAEMLNVTVLEAKPPQIESISRHSAGVALDAYKKYVAVLMAGQNIELDLERQTIYGVPKAEGKELAKAKKKPVSLRSCMTEKAVIIVKQRHGPCHMESDIALVKFLLDMSERQSVDQLVKDVQNVRINVKKKNRLERLNDAHADFLLAVSRIPTLPKDEDVKEYDEQQSFSESNKVISKKFILDAYVEMLKPERDAYYIVKQAYEREGYDRTTLSKLMDSAEEWMVLEDKRFRTLLESRAAQKKQDIYEKDDDSKPQDADKAKDDGEKHHQDNVMEQKSRRSKLGIPWIPKEEWSKLSVEEKKMHQEKVQKAKEFMKEPKVSAINAKTFGELGFGRKVQPKERIPVQVKIEGAKKPISALFDPGAMVSTITKAAITELGLRHKKNLIHESVMLRGVLGSSKADTMELYVTLTTGLVAKNVSLPWTFVIVPDDTNVEMLIGMDLILETKLGEIRPEGAYFFVPAKIGNAEEGDGDDIKPLETIEVRTLNVTEKAKEIQDELGKITYGEEMPKEWKRKFGELMQEFKDVFDPELEPGGAKIEPVKLVMKPTFHAGMVQEAPRFYPNNVRQALNEKWKLETEAGRLETPAPGACASRVTVVPKGGLVKFPREGIIEVSQIRDCMDARAVNKHMVKYEGPMRSVEHSLQRIAGHNLYFKTDKRTAFQQMPLAKESRPICAQITEDDYKQPTTLPPGLLNSAGIWQANMNIVHAAQIGKSLEPFVDDDILYGEEFESLFKEVRIYLMTLRERRLRIRADKTYVAVKKVEAIGHIVSKEGRTLSAKAVASVAKLAAPSNFEELRMVLGVLNYCRETIPDASRLMAPVSDILGDVGREGTWLWSAEHQIAFEKCKEYIEKNMQLGVYVPGDRVVVRTDASKVGLGGVIMVKREIDGLIKEIPLYLMSKKFSPTQSNWTTPEQELYAILWTITESPLAEWLKTLPITIETDHKNIVYLEAWSNECRKLANWKSRLGEYDASIVHIAGVDNIPTDGFSRLQWVQARALAVIKEYTFIIKLAHVGNAGHRGVAATLYMLRGLGVTWATMSEDVAKFIAECVICQKFKPTPVPPVPMRSIPIDGPFKEWCMDAQGPFPTTKDGYQYLLNCICPATRYVEIVATKTLKAEECMDALVDVLFKRYGIPSRIRSDRGSQFNNRVMGLVCRYLNIEHHMVLAGDHEPLVERANKETLKHMRILVSELGKTYAEWMQVIPLVQKIINSTVHTSLGVTPEEMVFGKGMPTSFIDVLIKEADTINAKSILEKFPELKPSEEEMGSSKGMNYVEKLTERLNSIRQAATIVQKEALEKYKKNKNKEAVDREFKEGDMVLVLLGEGRTEKLQPEGMGPFKVLGKAEKPHELAYRVESLVNPGYTKVYHRKHLVPLRFNKEDQSSLVNYARADEKELIVYEIHGHRYQDTTGAGKKQTLFLDTEFEGGRRSWEPYQNFKVKGTNDLMGIARDYLDEHKLKMNI